MSCVVLYGGVTKVLPDLSDLSGVLMRYVWSEPSSCFDLEEEGACPDKVAFWSQLFQRMLPGAYLVVECPFVVFHRLGALMRVGGFSLRDTLFLANSGVVGEGGSVIALASKPVEHNYAYNVMQYGVGALNIDESRLPSSDGSGRWPANVLHDATVGSIPPPADNPRAYVLESFSHQFVGNLSDARTLQFFGALIVPPGGDILILGADDVDVSRLVSYGLKVIAVSEFGSPPRGIEVDASAEHQPSQEAKKEETSVFDLWLSGEPSA